MLIDDFSKEIVETLCIVLNLEKDSFRFDKEKLILCASDTYIKFWKDLYAKYRIQFPYLTFNYFSAYQSEQSNIGKLIQINSKQAQICRVSPSSSQIECFSSSQSAQSFEVDEYVEVLDTQSSYLNNSVMRNRQSFTSSAGNLQQGFTQVEYSSRHVESMLESDLDQRETDLGGN